MGFRGAILVSVWMYISPFISPTWWARLENRRVKEKALEAIIADTPYTLHNRRMDLLKEKTAGTGHSDFLMNLKE